MVFLQQLIAKTISLCYDNHMGREFNPLILETKQQLHEALKQGKLRVSKYNVLSDDEKLFVELIVFGEYTPEQAIKSVKPNIKSATAAANRMLADKNVLAALEELTTSRDKRFLADLSNARSMALQKLRYIMTTTDDEAISLSAAKIIMQSATKVLLEKADKKEGVDNVKFTIQVENMVVNPRQEADEFDGGIVVDVPEEEKPEETEALPEPDFTKEAPQFVLNYEGVDNYS